MELEDIKKLLALLHEGGLKKIQVRKGDFEVLLEKEDSSSVLPVTSISTHQKEEKRQEDETEKTGKYVKSPMIGTFYTSSSPDQPPFVKKGDKVTADSIVCIIEAMKVMNEVKAGMSGTIVEIFVENAQTVEFGSKLFRIE